MLEFEDKYPFRNPPAVVFEKIFATAFTGIHRSNVEPTVVNLPSFSEQLLKILIYVETHPEITGFRFVQIKTKFDWICLYYNTDKWDEALDAVIKNAEKILRDEFTEFSKKER